MLRYVVWFSAGAASAVLAKLAVPIFSRINLEIVYCDLLNSEHEDNQRFINDIQEWIQYPIKIIKSTEYQSIDEVFEKTKYMSGPKGARCTIEMKKIPRFKFQTVDDVHLFGLTYDEEKRIKQFENNNPELELFWILKLFKITKKYCYEILNKAGIKLPLMYELGFSHNNCIGCVKASSSKYWNLVRKHFPEVFNKRVEQSKKLGVSLVWWKGQRIPLELLPVENVSEDGNENIECGPVCLGG